FLLARPRADCCINEACALSNVIYCLENLGFPFSDPMSELGELLRQMPKEQLTDVRAQFLAFQHRADFHERRIAPIFRDLSQVTGQVTQADHYRIWISELPFHRFFRCFDASQRVRYLIANPHLFMKRYRIRTLEGILHPADLVDFVVKELCDRVYLWT